MPLEIKDFSRLINNIEKRLVDEMSLDVFYARLKYLIYNDIADYRNDILDIGMKNNWHWKILQMDWRRGGG